MAPSASTARPSRTRRDEVLGAAVALADRDGLDALSMRALAREMGAAPMALYRHVSDKDDLLDGMVELVHARFPLPDADDPRTGLRTAYVAAFDVLLRHPWAAGLSMARPALGPRRLRHTDATLAALEALGCSLQQAHTAMHALDTHLFGFALQVHSTWAQGVDFGEEAAAVGRGERADRYPLLSRMLGEVQHDHDREYAEILDLLLDGIASHP
jgi:AcrR family transcriptional regulator